MGVSLRLVLALMVGMVAGLLVLAGGGSNSYYFEATQILTLCLAMALAGLVYVSLSARAYPVLLMGLHYLVFFYLAPALGQLASGRFPFLARSYSAGMASAAAMVVLVFVAVLLGACVVLRWWWPTPRGQRADPTEPQAGVVLACCALSVAAALTFGYGRLGLSRGAVDDLGLVATPLMLIVQTVARAAGFIAMLLAVLGLRQRRDLTWISLAGFSLLVGLAANNPLALPRFMLGAYGIIAWLMLTSAPRWARIGLLALVPLAQVSVFPLLSTLSRGAGGALRWDPVGYLVSHGDFDGFQSTMNVVAMSGPEGLRLGRQLASAALFFWPGAAAAWKSPGTGVEGARYMGYAFTNISAPLPGELFVDFGYAGLVPLTISVAALMMLADRAYASWRNGLGRLAPAIAAGYAIILFRGSLVGVVGPFVCMLALALLVRRLQTALAPGHTV